MSSPRSDPVPLVDFRMPSLGADMEFGKLVQWHVQAGDRVRRGQVVAEVETQKGVFAVEVFADGVVQELTAVPGTKAPVGAVLARIRVEAGAEPSAARAPAPPTVAPPSAAPAPVAPPPVAPPSDALRPQPGARPPRASPLARRIAEARGVDLTQVRGTGASGAITKADVERAAEPSGAPTALGPAPPPPLAPTGDGKRAMREAVAAAVTRSKREIPHYYLSTDIDCSRAMAWLGTANASRPVEERILAAALQLKAVAVALRKFPDLNGFWSSAGFTAAAAIHIGVLISMRNGGLIAPAIHDVDRLPVADVMKALRDLVRRAREGGLRGSEMTDATISVSNLGDEGVQSVFGVIYPPQVALVGFGRILDRPWADRGMLDVRSIVTATLAADHRATDGHYGALYLREVERLLQTPENL